MPFVKVSPNWILNSHPSSRKLIRSNQSIHSYLIMGRNACSFTYKWEEQYSVFTFDQGWMLCTIKIALTNTLHKGESLPIQPVNYRL